MKAKQIKWRQDIISVDCKNQQPLHFGDCGEFHFSIWTPFGKEDGSAFLKIWLGGVVVKETGC